MTYTPNNFVAEYNPLPVSIFGNVAAANIINRSGTIASAGVAQQLMPANTARRGGWIQPSNAGDIYISDIGTATDSGGSLRIPAGTLYEFPSNGVPATAISVIGSVNGQAFTAREW